MKYRKSTRCWSWRIRRGRPVRCTWSYWHANHSKWHCAERAGGWVWLVRRRPEVLLCEGCGEDASVGPHGLNQGYGGCV